MGLGPTVCCRCLVFADSLVGPNDHRCPVCKKDDDLEYLWLMTNSQQTQVENNSKFYRFVRGKDND